MGNDTWELDLKNESVTTDLLLGDVQFDPVARPEQHQFKGSRQTIEWDSLVKSAGRSSSVSGCKLAMETFVDDLREQVFHW